MELLLLIENETGEKFSRQFTFQYGATATLLLCNSINRLNIFTFQYGATATCVGIASKPLGQTFTFQYGATATLLELLRGS